MLVHYHHDVRTTLTLDSDVAARIKAEVRRSGLSFKAVVNEHLRAAFAQRRAARDAPRFRVDPRSMAGPAPGLSYDDIGALLETVEGSHRR